MINELNCPECDYCIELDYDYTKVACPGCGALLKLEVDAELVDGSWKDLSYLIITQAETCAMTKHEQQWALSKWADSVGYSRTFMDDDGCEQPGLLDTDDLNVLHEMEERLLGHRAQNISVFEERDSVTQRAWEVNLYCVIRRDDFLPDNYLIEMYRCANATAAQRRETLLKTLGLWK